MQDQIVRTDTAHATELQRIQKQIEKLQKSERESSIRNTLGQAKQIIWTNIIEAMNEIFPYIQINFEQK